MAHYVIGDIHGCYDEFMQLVKKINKIDKRATYILVGDIIDRGPKVMEMIDWAMKNITTSGKYQMVLGNHELINIKNIKDYFLHRNRYRSKENITIKDFPFDHYTFRETLIENKVSDSKLYEILIFFQGLPLYKEIRCRGINYVVAHADIPYSILNNDGTFKYTDLSESDKEYIVWERNIDYFDKINNSILVHGHTPTQSSQCLMIGSTPGRVHFTPNKINVDCGCVYNLLNSRLGAIRLEDLTEFYDRDNYESKNEHKTKMIGSLHKH